ncbi:hypothetical protein E2C01_095779 [Portunus trituberculatus]|uniref:Uncharacterized protein n=1 Tax=Portunus trituberculatus TaxID=210409 RepID=A0A5B7K6L6_PORTR|nr:hypothetical protein [Portunus trituberculatus]
MLQLSVKRMKVPSTAVSMVTSRVKHLGMGGPQTKTQAPTFQHRTHIAFSSVSFIQKDVKNTYIADN